MKKTAVHIRWMLRRDLPEVLAIEEGCFEFPWKEDDFVLCLKKRNCIGMVAEHDGRVVGFMVYELEKTKIRVLDFAVHPACWRKKIGLEMVGKLKYKLSSQRRNRLVLEVRETNLDAQLFFKAMGFEAVNTLKDFYYDTDEDAYVFVHRHIPIASKPRKSYDSVIEEYSDNL